MDLFATALPALGEALTLIFQPKQLLYLASGVLLGLSVGVFPGLGGIAGLSMLLPFIYGMDPVSGLSLMVGLIAVIPTSDTFASVLMGIPGSSASQATVLDGFPLAKQGQAARALAAAFASSLFGGLVGAVVLSFFILIARPIVLAFGLPEMLMITLLGLSMVSILAGALPLRGAVAAGLGLMVGTIGEADAGGGLRMASYSVPYLFDGLSLVIVGLGVFAIPEIVTLLRSDQAIAREATLGAGWIQGLRDWWANLWLSVRCSVIGVIIGVIPGLGGAVVDWIAYGYVVQSAKDKSRFGKGDIRGVIAPESSNNAKEGGGLVPTLIFGIPGSGSMAVFIGGLILLGYEAGPRMVTHELDLTYTIVWSLAIANVLGAGLCIFLSGPIARLTTIRFTLIAPFLFIMIAFAAFQSRQSLGDLAALMAIGLLGLMLRRFDWSRPAFLIGFVLSNQAENYSFQAYQIAASRFRTGLAEGLSYVFSPIVIVLFAVTLASVVLGLRQARTLPASAAPTGSKRAPMAFLVLVALYMVVSFFNAAGLGMLTDKIFPMAISAVTFVLAVILMIRSRRLPEDHGVFADLEARADMPHGLWRTLAWFAALLAGTALLGFVLAQTVFLILFLRLRARLGWVATATYTVAALGFICAMAALLNRDFPPGLLQMLVDLPWPLR